jgi:hypothetical protein
MMTQKLTLDEIGVKPEDAAQVIFDLRRDCRTLAEVAWVVPMSDHNPARETVERWVTNEKEDEPDPQFLPLPRLANLSQCPDCGSAVADLDKHEQWHTTIGRHSHPHSHLSGVE